MSEVELEFHGIHVMEPENDLCALFRWVQGNRILPVWLSPIDGSQVMQRLGGYEENRPTTHDLLIDFAETAGGVEALQIVNHYEGTFMVDIIDATGQTHDARMCEALALSDHFGVPITIEEELVSQVAVFATPEDIEEYFGVSFDSPASDGQERPDEENESDTSASGNPQADADFEEMMRSLGMSEEDFHQGEEEKDSNDTRVTNDENGDEEV
ncbi:bifunctional nuclease family protein [Corynebacterium sp.]|uniref:bifunctional nuclease family protein n=1 Tax=Corynebacterium sp. TaxID=1720 RepID=UPI0026DB33AD|nr:bifunctional nuclease family protein [Corynebacterium sp.]MDO5031620.1 bifunctional nuclease family protein [Corynebacterium sp.]